METQSRSNEMLKYFFQAVRNDSRLTPIHMSLYFVLFRYWQKGGEQNPIQVKRRSLMSLSKIKSTASYHKVLKDLEGWGYINYFPSFHPAHGSLISLVFIMICSDSCK